MYIDIFVPPKDNPRRLYSAYRARSACDSRRMYAVLITA